MEMNSHPFDLQLSHEEFSLFVEELPESMQFASNCVATVATAGTAVGGCMSSISSASCGGCIISCG
jgi:hypothetical protein